MIKKKIVITAGGTCEYIDDVRLITNISSGRLATAICDEFMKRILLENNNNNYEIVFIHGKFSETPKNINVRCIKITTTGEAMAKILEECIDADVIIHSMAVSDFGLRKLSGKLSSNSTESMLESMRERIFVNPKIINLIKNVNTSCYLVGFKFLSNATMEQENEAINKLFISANCDMIVYNDKKNINKDKHETSIYVKSEDKNLLFERLHINYTKEETAKYLADVIFPVPCI